MRLGSVVSGCVSSSGEPSPYAHGFGSEGSIVGCRHAAAGKIEEVCDRVVNGNKALEMAG